MTSSHPTGASELTRRQVLQAGGAGATAAFLLLHLPATAGAARGANNHLLRSTWRDLEATNLRSGSSVLRLESVGDLSAAPNVPSLRNSEDAFSLVFSGPRGLGHSDRPLRVTNGDLGTFDLFVSPLDDGKYEAVVNRVLSNRESRRTPPRRKRSTAKAPDSSRRPSGDTEPLTERAIRKVRIGRKGSAAKVVIDLAPSAGVNEVVVWLKRDGKVIAAGTKKVRKKRRATLMLKKRRGRIRRGLYEVDVMALERDGEQTHRRVRKRLR
jgi:hypothetical protein